MSDHQLTKDEMERLARVNGKLEPLLVGQTLQKDGGLSETLHSPGGGFSEAMVHSPADNQARQKPGELGAPVEKPRPARVAISAREVDAIFQRVEKIQHDAEILARVEKLERQTRTITILGSMSMTLTILVIGLLAFFMAPATLLHTGVFWSTRQKVDASQPPLGKATAKVPVTPVADPKAPVNDRKSVEPVAKVGDPAAAPSVAPGPAPRPAEGPAPVKYVGFLTSNKYHDPGCKWAAGITHYRHRTFSSVQEARDQGYRPCPTCKPPHSD